MDTKAKEKLFDEQTAQGKDIAAMKRDIHTLQTGIENVLEALKDLAKEVRASGAASAQLLLVAESVAKSLEEKVRQDAVKLAAATAVANKPAQVSGGILAAYLHDMSGNQKTLISVMTLVIIGTFVSIGITDWFSFGIKGK